MNAFPEYVSPVPAVVVAYDPTTPPYTASPPFDRDGRFRVPANSDVDDAYVNEASVVDVLENVLSAVNVLAVYVFGMVVLPLMNELTFVSPYVLFVRHTPLTAKHPVVMLNPTLDVLVAEPEMLSPERVVVPKPPLETVNHGAVVEPTQNEKASPATESIARRAAGVVVPTPSFPLKNEFAVVVEIKFPTVNCVPVAIKLPLELVVMIELVANVVAANTWVESVEVETVCTRPFEPMNEYPCDRSDSFVPFSVVEDSENRPAVNPIAVDVEL